MKKLIINGKIGGEASEFIEAILSGLEDNRWLKKALKHCLKLNPAQAHDEVLILFEAVRLRANEASGLPLDEN
ncbi:MAG: hypothetical protein HYY82_12165 [Deltaproteobacteria bacterium]|nr:hypothetical protein [Deltaproteobacteria bacterium]